MSGCHDTLPGRATGLSKDSADPLHLLSIIERHGFACIKELREAGYQIRSVQGHAAQRRRRAGAHHADDGHGQGFTTMKLARKGLVSPARSGAGRADFARAATFSTVAPRPGPPSGRSDAGVTETYRAVTPTSFCVTEIVPTTDRSSDVTDNALGAKMPKSNVIVTAHVVNLRRTIARAVSHAPVKVVAREYGISAREVATLRTELGFPRVPIFLEIAKRDPALKAQVIAILSGDGEAGTPERINELIAFLQGKR